MDEYVREFVDEAEEAITRLNNLLLDLERSPDDAEILQEIFRTAHTLKGNAGAMGLDRANDLAHAMEDLLDAVRAGSVEVTPERMDTLFAAVDCLEAMIDEIAVEGTIQTDPTETIATLRAPLSDDSVDVTPPSRDERSAILSRFSPPSNPDHDAYLVRMAIADSAELNNGLVVIEALHDAFDLIGTDPSRTAIENEEYGKRIDAVFGTAVGEAAISAALEPVDAVEAFSILTVTGEIEDRTEESDSFSPIDEELSADISSDEANEMEVDDLLDEFTDLDDIDALAEEVDDVSEFEDIGDAGSFDDIIPETSSESAEADATAADGSEPAETTEEDSVEDAGAVFDELKQEVDMVGFDELQDELDELEFEEFDEEEVGMDELLGDEVDVDDPSFLDVDEPSSPTEAERGPAPTGADESATAETGSTRDVTDTSADSEDPISTPESVSSPSATESPSPAAESNADRNGDVADVDPTDSPGEPAESAEAPSVTGAEDEHEPSPGDAETPAESSAFADELFSGGDDGAGETDAGFADEVSESAVDDVAVDPDEVDPTSVSEGSEPSPVEESPSGTAPDSEPLDGETPSASGADEFSDATDDAAAINFDENVDASDESDAQAIDDAVSPAGDDAAAHPTDDADGEIPDSEDDAVTSAASDADPVLDPVDREGDEWSPEFDVGAETESEPVDSSSVDEPTSEPIESEGTTESDAAGATDDAADQFGSADADVDGPATADVETSESDTVGDTVAFDLDEASDVPVPNSATEEVEDVEATDVTTESPDDPGSVSEPEPSDVGFEAPIDDTGTAPDDEAEADQVETGSTDEFDDVDASDSIDSTDIVEETAQPDPSEIESRDADVSDSVPDVDRDPGTGDDAVESESPDSPDHSPQADSTEANSDGDLAGEADAFDLSAGLDDLGAEFDAPSDQAETFDEDAETAGFASESWDDDSGGPDDSADADDVPEFDTDLAFETETTVGSDAANDSDGDFGYGSDFDTSVDASVTETQEESTSFGDADGAVDTSGTDFDGSADEEASSSDDVLSKLPEMEVPDIEIPSPAELETEADLEDRAQSVRVDREQIDSLLQLVEGLVTSRVRLRTAVNDREPYESIERELEELEDFTSELQETVMDVRLVPLQTVTNRLPRVVRDLAREQDKEVTFDQSDADVELDRSILDRIGDPLIHLVRNAIDHGIEDAETREEAGKPPEGTIELSAKRTQNRVQIEISDDGKGLDADRLRDAAVAADVLSREEADDLSDDEAYDLVFHSGLSTADEVTDVSGRGVGMDVVRRTIDELSGTVSIDSEPGEGTSVRMTLPVTVAVDDVVFVESGGEQFGIPVDVVRGIADGAHVTQTDEGLVFDTDDETLPVIELGDALDTGESQVQDPDGMVVRIRDEVRDVGLKCDLVHARREVVVNPFEGFMRNIPGVSGATVRGRGEVITILDVSTL